MTAAMRETGMGTAAGAAGGVQHVVDVPDLVRRARRDDRAAFAALYRHTITPVYRYLAARVDSTDRAEELTQEVFLAALATIDRLCAEDEVGVLGWLLQIARHKLADSLRQRYRRQDAPLDEEVVSSLAAIRDADPHELVEAGEARAALRQALETLTPEQREVIVCKYVLDYGNERTARLMGKNTNAVNQLHHRALATLHRFLSRREAADARR
jgi:RNA polymerase sigma-70 factor (ECF subfamily)